MGRSLDERVLSTLGEEEDEGGALPLLGANSSTLRGEDPGRRKRYIGPPMSG